MSLNNILSGFVERVHGQSLILFCLSVFVVLELISIFGFSVNPFSYLSILYTGLIFGFIAFFLWYKELDQKNEARKLVKSISTYFFGSCLLVITLLDLNLLNGHSSLKVMNIILIFSAVLSGFTALYFYKDKTQTQKKINWRISGKRFELTKKWFYVAGLTLVLILGIILTTYHIDLQSINVDEGILAIVAQNINRHYLPVLDNGQFYSRGYLYTYPLALIYLLFGKTLITTRLISISVFLISIILFYFLCKKTFLSKGVALLGSLMFVLLPLSIQFSRFARMYSLNLFVEVLLMLVLICYLQSRNTKILYFGIPVFILGFLSHNLFIFNFIAFVTSLFLMEKTNIVNFVLARKRILFPLTVFLLLVSFFVFVYLRNSTKVDVVSNIQLKGYLFDIIFVQYSYLTVLLIMTIIATANTFSKIFTKNYRANTEDLFVINAAIPLFLTDILIYSNFPTYRVRYIYHLIPLLIVITLFYLIRLIKINRIFYILIPLLVSIFVLNTNLNILENRPIIKYDGIKEIHVLKSDVLISNNPVVSSFYLGRLDYWLILNQNEINLYSYRDQGGISRYVYTNSRLLNDSNAFREIVNRNHGYIILDPAFDNFLGNSFTKEVSGKNIRELSRYEITIIPF